MAGTESANSLSERRWKARAWPWAIATLLLAGGYTWLVADLVDTFPYRWDRVHVGDKEEQVLALLGEPSQRMSYKDNWLGEFLVGFKWNREFWVYHRTFAAGRLNNIVEFQDGAVVRKHLSAN